VDIQETSRDISFCAHAIMEQHVIVIPDATKDKRFAKNPLVVSEPRIRFYAGAPLITPDGHALGTLCVLDKKPHNLRPDQKRALEILSRHVMTQLELRRHGLELAKVRKEREKVFNKLRAARAELNKAKKAMRNAEPPTRQSIKSVKGVKGFRRGRRRK
jgi:GAF domain-containing protein